MMIIHKIEQGSEAWHEARQGKYTGSNAHKLLGSYGAVEYAQAMRSNFKGNFWTKRGSILESEACELYETITGNTLEHCGFVTNEKYPNCLYSPDGFTETRLIEVKCFDEKEHMKLIKGDIKFSVMAQLHFGLLITGLKVADLIAYNPTMDDPLDAFKIIEVKANRNISNNLKRILA